MGCLRPLRPSYAVQRDKKNGTVEMISKAERQHLVILKQWSVDGRAALRKLQAEPIGRLLRKIMSDKESEIIYDNVDWLLELIARENHTAGVRALINEGVPLEERMSSTNDWATTCAQRIKDEIEPGELPTVARVAAIIAAHAEPLMALLREAKREHRDDCLSSNWSYNTCICGASAWNAKVDAAVEGVK